MSKAADNVTDHLTKYLRAMEAQGKKPSALYVSKRQFEDLRAARKGGPDFKPRFKGYEILVAK